MDKLSYPFNNAAPKRKLAAGGLRSFSSKRFPMAGAGEPLRGLTMRREDKTQMAAW